MQDAADDQHLTVATADQEVAWAVDNAAAGA